MAIDFVNPVTAGTVLVRSDIRSQNYSPGTAGWIIEADGDAEFNSVVIRGGTVISGTALYYDPAPGPGTLVASVAATFGTDPYGNAYEAGFTVYDTDGSKVQTEAGAGASIFFTPQTTGGPWFSGKILTTLDGTQRGGLQMLSPASTAHGVSAGITLFGGSLTTSDTICFIQADRTSINGTLELTAQPITQYDGDVFNTYTPSVTGGGSATFNVRTGWWQRIGKMVYFTAYFTVNVAGSGATAISVTAPTSLDRTTRQAITAHVSAVTASKEGPGLAVVFTGGSGSTIDRIVGRDNTNITGADLLSGALVTIEGWYREA